MGLIEKLRQEKEAMDALKHAAEHAAAERERLGRERRERIEEQRRRQELADQQLHKAYRSQAEQFRDESGITTLLNKIVQFIDRGTVEEEELPVKKKAEDSVLIGVTFGPLRYSDEFWKNHERYRIMSRRGFGIEICPDGLIHIHGGLLGSSTIPRNKWKNNKTILESAVEKAYRKPRTLKWEQLLYQRISESRGEMGPCLPGNAPIDTSHGFCFIKNLKVGDSIWTIDEVGNRVETVIIKTSRTPVKSNHKMLHIVLDDERELFVSSGHPDANASPLSKLVKGKYLDGAIVISSNIISYREKYTFDILPAGPTGNYWTNGILIGSTLFDKFEPFVASNFSSTTGLNL